MNIRFRIGRMRVVIEIDQSMSLVYRAPVVTTVFAAAEEGSSAVLGAYLDIYERDVSWQCAACVHHYISEVLVRLN